MLIERIAVMGLMATAEVPGISPRTARKWREHFGQEGSAGLLDRSSRPFRTRSTVDAELARRIGQLWRARMPMRRIAASVGRSVATVSRPLSGMNLSSPKALDPEPPVLQYEREAARQLLHMGTKKLGRIVRPNHRGHG